MKAPFPWFGGKSRVSHIVWDRFGNVANYVEPFFGSGAVLLNRPHEPGTETVNDLDCYLANFWRAVKFDPITTAIWADWPVNEADLHARHRWLVIQEYFMERMKTDPEFYDTRIAGWWVWGLSQWIGRGWCSGRLAQQLPHLADAGQGIHRYNGEWLAEYFAALSHRLRDVRVACGDWQRVLGDSVTVKHGITGVFLDPPYSDDEHTITYAAGGGVAEAVREWAIENGSNPLLRIALCGYDGEYAMPAEWQCVAWKANGGYGSQGNGTGRDNAHRERIWFSPYCLTAPTLFDIRNFMEATTE